MENWVVWEYIIYMVNIKNMLLQKVYFTICNKRDYEGIKFMFSMYNENRNNIQKSLFWLQLRCLACEPPKRVFLILCTQYLRTTIYGKKYLSLIHECVWVSVRRCWGGKKERTTTRNKTRNKEGIEQEEGYTKER